MNTPLFVTGIGTGVGKTIVSAIQVEQLKADYWKPVQAGDLHQSDKQTVNSLITNKRTTLHPETFRFQMAASPHKAAAFEKIEIHKHDFKLPQTENKLIIEGAGGLMVPLSNTFLMIDLIQLFKADAILVIRDYLGCINHSLLSIEALVNRGITIKKVIFNGEIDKNTMSTIIGYLPSKTNFSIVPEFKELSRQAILDCANLIKLNLHNK